MKKLLFIALALTLPLAQMVQADNNNNRNRKQKREAEAAAAAAAARRSKPANRPTTQPAHRSLRQAQHTQRRVTPTRRTINAQRDSARAIRRQPVRTANNNRGSNHRTAPAVNRGHNRPTVNRNRGNSRVNVARNRPHRNFDRNSFAVARARGVHQRHDRNWWRRYYGHTTFVLFGGGYYYWDAGYWYPAYGYSPIYNNYIYSEPIYGYNDLAPGQVLENVQLALRDLGYYGGPIDGLIGPQTRDALAAFQRDNGLVQTAAVDEPTLVTLGLA